MCLNHRGAVWVNMGTFFVEVEIGDPEGAEFVMVSALVDTGSTHTSLPESLLSQLGVRPRAERVLWLANGERERRQVGQTMMRWEDEEFMVPVIFGSDDAPALLGATSLQAFALVVDSEKERLIRAEAQPW